MKLLRTLATLAFTLTIVSCSSDDDGNNETLLTENEIPDQIMSYLSEHFPDNDIIKTVQDNDDGTTTYEVYLDGNYELDFNADYDITDIDGTSELPDSVIPQALLDYVSQNYADHYITDWELESSYQQIELDNGVELEFEMDGTFIRVDND